MGAIYLGGHPMAPRHEIKRLLFASFPDASLRFFSARSRRLIENYAREYGLDRLATLVSSQTGGTVLTGPFKDMKLNYQALPVNGAPKFLGTYEKEIVRFIGVQDLSWFIGLVGPTLVTIDRIDAIKPR